MPQQCRSPCPEGPSASPHRPVIFPPKGTASPKGIFRGDHFVTFGTEAITQKQQRRSLLASVSAAVAGSRNCQGLRVDDIRGTLIAQPDSLRSELRNFGEVGRRSTCAFNFDRISCLLLSRKEVSPARIVRHDLYLCSRSKAPQNILSPSGDSLLFTEKEVSKKSGRNQTHMNIIHPTSRDFAG